MTDRIHQIEIANDAAEVAEVVQAAAAELNCFLGDEVNGNTSAAWYDDSARWYWAEAANLRNRDSAAGLRTMASVLHAAADRVRHLENVQVNVCPLSAGIIQCRARSRARLAT